MNHEFCGYVFTTFFGPGSSSTDYGTLIFYRLYCSSWSQRFSSLRYLFFSMKRMKFAHWTGVKMDLISSIKSYNSMLFSSISVLIDFSAPINFSRTFFCSCKNTFLDCTYFLCYYVRFNEFFNSLYQSSVSSSSFSLKRWFSSDALHIM